MVKPWIIYRKEEERKKRKDEEKRPHIEPPLPPSPPVREDYEGPTEKIERGYVELDDEETTEVDISYDDRI